MKRSPSLAEFLMPCASALWWLAAGAFFPVAAAGQVPSTVPRSLALQEALNQALVHKGLLQIERINPEIARMTLRASWGYYDPIFSSQGRHDDVVDTGGFDPVNPTTPNVGYSLRTDSANLGINGFLPSGLTYNLGSSYVHGSGYRNGLNLDSYRVAAGISLQQPLLKNFWIDLPRWTIRVNRGNLQISELGVRFVAMDVVKQIEQGYADLVYTWENLRVEQDLLSTREQFLTGIKRKVERSEEHTSELQSLRHLVCRLLL